ncbi:MAG: AraC family transcriptional regulator [Lachnospiraceae bacterium]|nr:AraC family transcriptional regulator [Lachnospiraceae bacterium]
MELNNKLDYQLFVQRENMFLHQPYKNELDFYSAIKNGDIEYIEEMKRKYSSFKDTGKGRLSKNPLQNERYHFVTNTALVTRNCIEAGLPQETAYTLSDLYIQEMDKLFSIGDIQELNDKMVYDFTMHMKELHKSRVVSHHIRKCIEYIYNNLHEPLTVSIIARQMGLNPSYLSTLFKKETGSTIHAFIQGARLDTAAGMLKNTEYPYALVSNTLCFSSQSHFTKLFRERTGLTPKEYRLKYSVK